MSALSAQTGGPAGAAASAAGTSLSSVDLMAAAFPDSSAAWTALTAACSLFCSANAGPCCQAWYYWRQDTGRAADAAGRLDDDDAAGLPQAVAREAVTISDRPVRMVTTSARVLVTATSTAKPIRNASSRVPQIPSGIPSTTTRQNAQAPATAVRSQRPVNRTQHGPIKAKPLRTIRRPVDASTTATSEDHARPSCHNNTARGSDNAQVPRQRRLNAGEGPMPGTIPGMPPRSAALPQSRVNSAITAEDAVTATVLDRPIPVTGCPGAPPELAAALDHPRPARRRLHRQGQRPYRSLTIPSRSAHNSEARPLACPLAGGTSSPAVTLRTRVRTLHRRCQRRPDGHRPAVGSQQRSAHPAQLGHGRHREPGQP